MISMSSPLRLPARYRDYFVEVMVDGPPVIMTSVGPRPTLARRWKCNRCAQLLKPNTAAAQSHVMKHVRQVESAGDRRP